MWLKYKHVFFNLALKMSNSVGGKCGTTFKK